MVTVRRLLFAEAALASRVVIEVKPGEERRGHRPDSSFMEHFLATDSNYLFAALEDEEPIGYALAYRLPRIDGRQDMLYLHDIAVLTTRRGQGVGRQLINAVLECCRAAGLLKMFLITDNSNEAARRLYARTGGRPTDDQMLFVYEFNESLRE